MSQFSDLVDKLEAHLAQSAWPNALLDIAQAVLTLVNDPRAKSVVFGSPEIDQLCQEAGAQAAASFGEPATTPFDPTLDVHLATEVMRNSGGHMHALRDIIHARPHVRHVVLLSNLHNKELELPDLAEGTGAVVQILVAPPGDIGMKTLWLMHALRQLRPARLVLFNHHHDAACVAAAQPGAAAQTLYFHHCDHDMALGVFLPHAGHIDCSNVMVERCSHQFAINDVLYWPLVARDQGVRSAGHQPLSQPRGLVTCSHGSHVKFLAVGRYKYFEVIQQRLRDVPGKHLHVGSLPEAALQQFRQNLAASDIDPSRFEHVQPVPSLWAWLRDSAVDIVISSIPVQGFKGLVETMGAGIPVLIHASALSKMQSTPELAYPEVLRWRTPAELVEVLRGLDVPMLQAHAAAARTHYERWHHPRELAYAVNNARLTAPVPPTRPLQVDTLALYWR